MLSCRPPSPPRRRGAVVHRPAQEDETNPPPAPRPGPCHPPSRLRHCPGVGRPLACRAAGASPRAAWPEAVPAGSCVGVGASGGSRACECSASAPGLGLGATRAASTARKAPAGRRPETPASAAHALRRRRGSRESQARLCRQSPSRGGVVVRGECRGWSRTVQRRSRGTSMRAAPRSASRPRGVDSSQGVSAAAARIRDARADARARR